MIIGIDESYTKCGLAICIDGELKKVTSIDYKRCESKTAKRNLLKGIINKVLSLNVPNVSQTYIICERIRTFSQNPGNVGKIVEGNAKGFPQIKQGPQSFISTDYIKSTGALIATIVDAAAEHGIKVFSVDTRSWKSKVVGTSKHKDKQNKKMETVKFITSKGFNLGKENRKGVMVYDDDAADAACIALYGFIPKDLQKLKLET